MQHAIIIRPTKIWVSQRLEHVYDYDNLPIIAEVVMIAKPSARPTRSTNLAVGNLMTPPMIPDRILVVPVKGNALKLDVT